MAQPLVRLLPSCAVLVLWISVIPRTNAQAGTQAPTNPTLAFATELRTRADLPAVTVAVAIDGTLVASEAVGLADVGKKSPAATSHLFRIGSLSKLLTATAALRLQQAGRFDLDAPLRNYLPSVSDDKANITARQILGHLSGFGHYGTGDYVNTVKFTNVDESVPRLLAMPLVTAPGAKYAYSSYAYNVLGSALQAAGGKEFAVLVRDLVTAPLGLTRTAPEKLPAPAARAALYGRGSKNEIVPAQASDVSDRWPSGGYLSTAEELAKFGVGILQAGFLTADLREAAFATQRDADGTNTNVGLAWRIARDPSGRRYVHHGGDAIGGRAFLLVYPDQKIAVAIATNIGRAGFGEKDALSAVQPFLRLASRGSLREY
jgi:CubicO group peptidase (beta-lactamase class C family)